MKGTLSGVSNLLDNIFSAMKNRKIINRKVIIITYCLLKFTYYFFAS